VLRFENKAILSQGIDRALDLFPVLKLKLHQSAGELLGGERQMISDQPGQTVWPIDLQ